MDASTLPNDVSIGWITLRGEKIPTRTMELPQSRLHFFVDNPRIYSLIRIDESEPSQEEICVKLLKHEHVKELVHNIRDNGGLVDPVIVRDGDYCVLEGNSRLAAYRYLAQQDPIEWQNIRCTLLPADIDEKLVFALLGEYHIKGKKDWAPYERAGFLYRRHTQHNVSLSDVAQELGISSQAAGHIVNVYRFMIDHNDRDRERWSYYDEFLKSNKIKKVREEHADFDDFIVGQIKDGQFSSAMELRNKLPAVCTAGPELAPI